MPGVVLVEKPGYPKSLNLTRKGYTPITSGTVVPSLLIFTLVYWVGIMSTFAICRVVTCSTGIINFRMDQLHHQ